MSNTESGANVEQSKNVLNFKHISLKRFIQNIRKQITGLFIGNLQKLCEIAECKV